MTLVYDRYINDLTKSGDITKEDAEYFHAYTVTGCIGVIQKWLNDDMKKSTKYMAQMVFKLDLGPSVNKK
jgi:hypothetical protein